MLEKDIERQFYLKCRSIPNVQCYKLVIDNSAFWPDRTILLDGGHCFFMEFKRPKGVVSKGQEILFNRLRKKGFRVYVVHSLQQALEALQVEINYAGFISNSEN